MTTPAKPRTLGRLSPSAFGCLAPDRPDPRTMARFRQIPDLTGTISDAMDLLGIEGAISGSLLIPSLPGTRVAGPALTVLNRRRTDDVPAAVAARKNLLADIEAHNLALPGDIVVVQGVEGASSLGGIAASLASRQREAAIIVDGYVRDIDSSRGLKLPIWARGVTPLTGKWRAETVAINQPVRICGVVVTPGDVIVADDTGVCVVPRASVTQVLDAALAIARNETDRLDAISAGTPFAELPAASYPLPSR